MFASLKQSRGFQVNEASDIVDHVLLAKLIKLRYSACMVFFLYKKNSWTRNWSSSASYRRQNSLNRLCSVCAVKKIVCAALFF